MYHECPLCGLEFYRESGYYVGAMIVNYGVVALVMIVAYLISRQLPEWWHAPVNTKILAWMGAAVVLSLALVPHARSLWLAVDYWIEPWKPAQPPGHRAIGSCATGVCQPTGWHSSPRRRISLG
jgi:uncharacterized protein (DUF983 family)